MKKIIGFNQGQIGDLAINMIPCKAVKAIFPDSHLVFSINKKYLRARRSDFFKKKAIF